VLDLEFLRSVAGAVPFQTHKYRGQKIYCRRRWYNGRNVHNSEECYKKERMAPTKYGSSRFRQLPLRYISSTKIRAGTAMGTVAGRRRRRSGSYDQQI
jgi:hypothetical protein